EDGIRDPLVTGVQTCALPICSDCVQVVIALIVTPDGFPLAYEVLPGNTSDKTTLRAFLARIEAQYGKAQRVWVMDRGIPTEAVRSEERRGGKGWRTWGSESRS